MVDVPAAPNGVGFASGFPASAPWPLVAGEANKLLAPGVCD